MTMLLIRCLVLVLIGLERKTWAVLYICSDLGLYLLIKILRDDFYYWLPLDGWTAVIVSLLSRIVIKVVTDFTSICE